MFSRIPFLIPVIAICEIFLIIQVGGMIGFWPTVGIVILTGITGVTLLRRQGFSLINQLQQKLNRGELPASEMLEGIALLMGGVMLITPGFITDILGLSLILPWPRKAMIALMMPRLQQSIRTQGGGFHYSGSSSFDPFGQGGPGFGQGQSSTPGDDHTTYTRGAAEEIRARAEGHEVIDGEYTREKEGNQDGSEKK